MAGDYTGTVGGAGLAGGERRAEKSNWSPQACFLAVFVPFLIPGGGKQEGDV